MKKWFQRFFKNQFVITILAVLTLFMAVGVLYKMLHSTKIYIEFKDLRPFHQKAPVYYKGFKIGKVTKIQPAEHYQSTIVTVVLHPKNLKLPSNTMAKLKIHKTRWFHKDYIDLIYPENPDSALLKRGSKIIGKGSIDMHSYFASIPVDSYEKMEENAAGILENLNDATGMLYSVFAIINGILTESEKNIKNTINNLSGTTKSTNQMMKKIDTSINQAQLQNTFNNINESAFYAKQTISGFTETAGEVNKTIPNLNSVLANSNCVMANLKDITCGIKNTMKKRFAGMRFIFGRPIDNNCLCK